MPAGSYNGAMAEYVVAPAEKIVPLPDHVSFQEAALAEPLSISLRATKHAGDVRGRTVVVFGAGPIGLLLIACLKRAGAGNIIAADVVLRRLEKAKEMGATHTAGAKENIFRLARELTGGTGADCVFDAAGVEETVNAGIEAVRNGGKIILVGMASPRINFELKHAVCKEARLIGSYMYTAEMEEALEIIAQGGIDVKKIITSVHPLSEGPRIFEELASGKTEDIKVILTSDA
ncbi:MAG: zinc-dependent alcohol dehydrogenase [Desulfotomaculales bacterium]